MKQRARHTGISPEIVGDYREIGREVVEAALEQAGGGRPEQVSLTLQLQFDSVSPDTSARPLLCCIHIGNRSYGSCCR